MEAKLWTLSAGSQSFNLQSDIPAPDFILGHIYMKHVWACSVVSFLVWFVKWEQCRLNSNRSSLGRWFSGIAVIFLVNWCVVCWVQLPETTSGRKGSWVGDGCMRKRPQFLKKIKVSSTVWLKKSNCRWYCFCDNFTSEIKNTSCQTFTVSWGRLQEERILFLLD